MLTSLHDVEGATNPSAFNPFTHALQIALASLAMLSGHGCNLSSVSFFVIGHDFQSGLLLLSHNTS